MTTRFFCLLIGTLLSVSVASGQNQVEENLWDQVMGAADYVSQANLVRSYQEKYCTNGTGAYCNEAERLWNQIGRFATHRQSACANLADGIEKINCLKDLLVEFETGDIAEEAQAELAAQELKLWTLINASEAWDEESFVEFLDLFPSTAYRETAEARLTFLRAEVEMTPAEFFEKFVTGQGAEILQQYSTRSENTDLATQASAERQDLEESFWEKTLQDGQREDYDRYLRWYPDGSYAPDARSQMDKISSASGSASRDRSIREWEEMLQSVTPTGVRDYLARHPRGQKVADAEKLLARLDLATWKRTPAGSNEISFEEYLKDFPDGAFKGRAKEATVSTEETESWQRSLELHSISEYQDYLSKFPQGFYRDDALRGLNELRPVEYSVQVENGWHVFHFNNAYQLEMLPYSKDSLIVDDQNLASDNQLRIKIHASGSHVIRLVDQSGKSVRIRLSRVLRLADFQEISDSIVVEVWGGSAPYEIKLQDTTMVEFEELYPQEFDQGLIRVAKTDLRKVVDPGTYVVFLRDRSETTNIQKAGLITIKADRKKTIIVASLVLLALLVFYLGWSRINRKVAGKKEIFDEMDNELDWGDEIVND